MNKLSKRLEKLESIMNPNPKRVVRVIQEVGETEAQALERVGLSSEDLDVTFVILRKIIEPNKESEMVTE